jgi:hypothetical protein
MIKVTHQAEFCLCVYKGGFLMKNHIGLNKKNEKNIQRAIAIAITVCAVFFALSCKGTPPTPTAEIAPPPVDPNTLPPEQDALDRLEAARARAQEARDQSLTVQAQVFFPDEWKQAEINNEAGKSAGAETLGQVNGAIAQFTRAAEGWEALTEQSGPLFAQAMEDARAAVEAAAARAEQSRKTAMDIKGNTYFPDDWKAAEGLRQQGNDAAKKTTPDELTAAAALYTSATDGYDDIAGRSAARFAQEQDEAQKKLDAQKLSDAQKALAAATARAEKSRQSAMEVEGQTYFANDWKTAESRLQTARGAKKATADEMQAATVQFNGAADAYDAIAGKARTQFAKDKDAASKDLQAAIARAQKSRTAVTTAKADAAFPADWKNAETRNTAATNAKRATVAEMKAAVPLYNTAADAYDEIIRKNTVRATAADAVAKAKARSEQSAAYAAAAGLELEGNNAQ